MHSLGCSRVRTITRPPGRSIKIVAAGGLIILVTREDASDCDGLILKDCLRAELNKRRTNFEKKRFYFFNRCWCRGHGAPVTQQFR